jgi:hypothetical protein
MLTLGACKGQTPAEKPTPPAAAAPAPPPPAVPPPAAPETPPPAAEPQSPLRTALLSIRDPDSLRAVAADRLRITDDPGKGKPKSATLIMTAKLDDKIFADKVKDQLPREPDPAGGEGEDFSCDDAKSRCVFRDEFGRATTYVFSAPPNPPKLREIRREPPPK